MSGGDEARSYLVECYWPGVSEEKLAVATRRVQTAAADLRRDGRELRFLGAILVPADETVFCLFDGEEADVRAVSKQAGVPFERVLESLRIDGNDRREEQCPSLELLDTVAVAQSERAGVPFERGLETLRGDDGQAQPEEACT